MIQAAEADMGNKDEVRSMTYSSTECHLCCMDTGHSTYCSSGIYSVFELLYSHNKAKQSAPLALKSYLKGL